MDRQGVDLFSNHEPMLEVKSALLRGQKHRFCSKCYEAEQAGVGSPRNGLGGLASYVERTNYFPGKSATEIEQLLLSLTPQQQAEIARLRSPNLIEISLDSTCDLKCMYCNLYYSTQWASEALQHGDVTPDVLRRELPDTDPRFEQLFWEWFESYAYEQAECINFIGGEPLIIDRYYQYMERITAKYLSAGRTRPLYMSAVTNLNTPPRYMDRWLDCIGKLLDCSSQTRMVIKISQESLGARAEFIRTGLSWTRFESNFNRLLRFKQEHAEAWRIRIDIIASHNALSVSDSPAFFAWVADLVDAHSTEIGINPQQIQYPQWLNVSVLPASYGSYLQRSADLLRSRRRHQIDDVHRDWLPYADWLDGLAKSIRDPHKPREHQQAFVRELDKLCHRRGLDFAATFPEMMEFYQTCKAL